MPEHDPEQLAQRADKISWLRGRKPGLNEEVGNDILSFVRGGSFPHVAAGAVGVGQSTFYRWMDWGLQAGLKAESATRNDDPCGLCEHMHEAEACSCGCIEWQALNPKEEMFREFREEIEQASREARVHAEIDVRKTKPLDWLLKGPGRNRPDDPGWSQSLELAGKVDTSASTDADLAVALEEIQRLKEEKGKG